MHKPDLTNYAGREQAYVKHYLLQQYLPELGYRVGRDWDSIAYIDGFAGPWQTKDPYYSDSSFGVAIAALRRCQLGLRNTHGRQVHMTSILVEQDHKAYSELKKFVERESATDFDVHALHGEFIQTIPAIEKFLRSSHVDPFRFVFLDPKGWARIPMRRLQ
jgi:three-Cys-motif partner protein